MKKTLSLILALVLCLSLCACGSKDAPETDGNAESNTPNNSQNETTEATEPGIDILGEWVWVGDNTCTITFNEDNTCLYINGDTLKYSVDTALEIITLYDSSTENFNIINENGIVKLSGTWVYVRAEDYETAHAEYLAEEKAKKQRLIENYLAVCSEGRTELQIGNTYNISDAVNMTVKDVIVQNWVEDDGTTEFDFALHISLENTSDKQLLLMDKSYIKSDVFPYKDYYSDLLRYPSDESFHKTSLSVFSTPGKPNKADQVLDANSTYEGYLSINYVNERDLFYSIENLEQPLVCVIIHLGDTEYYYNVSDLISLP